VKSSSLATTLGSVRIVFGAAALVAPGLARRSMRLPAKHDNPSGRLMAGLFGWREMALGAQVLAVRNHPERLAHVARMNSLVDFGDAASNAVPILRRQGIDSGAGTMFVTALAGGGAWLWLSRIAAREALAG
jgi:hypothetical protein